MLLHKTKSQQLYGLSVGERNVKNYKSLILYRIPGRVDFTVLSHYIHPPPPPPPQLKVTFL